MDNRIFLIVFFSYDKLDGGIKMFNQNCCNRRQNGCGRQIMEQVVEPTINKCVQKDFYHEVPHIMPIHTHFICLTKVQKQNQPFIKQNQAPRSL